MKAGSQMQDNMRKMQEQLALVESKASPGAAW